jgi:hypothetical protein
MADNTSKPKPQAFEFILLTSAPATRDPEIGRKVRSHVMRRFRHDKKSKENPKENSKDCCCRHTLEHVNLHICQGSASGHILLAPPTGKETMSFVEKPNKPSTQLSRTVLDSSRSDQFTCLPTMLTPTADALLDFCEYETLQIHSLHVKRILDVRVRPWKAGLPCIPTGPYIRQMLSQTITMEIFRMEAALLHRMNTADPDFGAAEYYRYMVSTIRYVNKALDHQTERYSDMTLAAINLLGISEVRILSISWR